MGWGTQWWARLGWAGLGWARASCRRNAFAPQLLLLLFHPIFWGGPFQTFTDYPARAVMGCAVSLPTGIKLWSPCIEIILSVFICLGSTGVWIGASCLLEKHTTAWATPPALSEFSCLCTESHVSGLPQSSPTGRGSVQDSVCPQAFPPFLLPCSLSSVSSVFSVQAMWPAAQCQACFHSSRFWKLLAENHLGRSSKMHNIFPKTNIFSELRIKGSQI